MFVLLRFVGYIIALPFLFALYLVESVYKPKPLEKIPVIIKGQPKMPAFSGALKVLTWNIQFCAGVTKVFFYDVLGDEKKEVMMVEAREVERNLPKIIELIKKAKPDVVLLQEVDAGSKRVQYRDQVERISQALFLLFPYSCSAYYINAPWEPNVYVLGAFKMKLVTLSRYPIKKAERIALPVLPVVWIDRIFRLQRCILSAEIQLSASQQLTIMNTHLEAFSKGSDVLKQEVEKIREILHNYEDKQRAWIIGGDFNLLATKEARNALPKAQQELYNPKTELQMLTSSFSCSPSMELLQGNKLKRYFTYAPNHPEKRHLDRTLDYLFFSKRLTVLSCDVLQEEGKDLSDHMPLLTEYQISGK